MRKVIEPPSLTFMFERIMQSHGLWMESKHWNRSSGALPVKWLKPLLDLGCIRETRKHLAWPDGTIPKGDKQFYYYDFAVTPEGIGWWIKERISEDDREGRIISIALLAQPRRNGVAPVEGWGIGSELTFSWEPEISAAFKALREGYFEYVYYSPGYHWRMTQTLTVRLTKSGMAFFDAVPRLQLECA